MTVVTGTTELSSSIPIDVSVTSSSGRSINVVGIAMPMDGVATSVMPRSIDMVTDGSSTSVVKEDSITSLGKGGKGGGGGITMLDRSMGRDTVGVTNMSVDIVTVSVKVNSSLIVSELSITSEGGGENGGGGGRKMLVVWSMGMETVGDTKKSVDIEGAMVSDGNVTSSLLDGVSVILEGTGGNGGGGITIDDMSTCVDIVGDTKMSVDIESVSDGNVKSPLDVGMSTVMLGVTVKGGGGGRIIVGERSTGVETVGDIETSVDIDIEGSSVSEGTVRSSLLDMIVGSGENGGGGGRRREESSTEAVGDTEETSVGSIVSRTDESSVEAIGDTERTSVGSIVSRTEESSVEAVGDTERTSVESIVSDGRSMLGMGVPIVFEGIGKGGGWRTVLGV